MADLKSLALSRSALLKFDPRTLKVKAGLNGRDLSTPENVEHVEWLAKSMAENGYIDSHPLEVFSEGDDVFVSDGHCRLAGVMLAISRGVEIQTVTCVHERRGTNDFERILNQNLANSGKRLTPLEEGHNIKRAINLGATIKQVAEKLGKSETYVSQSLDFQAAPAEVHAMVRAGEVSATLAAQVVRKRGSEGVEAIKKAVTTAKASGKGKATAKHIEAAGEAAYNEKRDPVEAVKIVDRGGDAWSVTIGRTDMLMSGDAWLKLCARITDTVRPSLPCEKPTPYGVIGFVATEARGFENGPIVVGMDLAAALRADA